MLKLGRLLAAALRRGGRSSQRHWHSHEDEFVYVLEGEVTLIEDGGETVLHAGSTCSDIDMMSSNSDGRFVHKDGTPYAES